MRFEGILANPVEEPLLGDADLLSYRCNGGPILSSMGSTRIGSEASVDRAAMRGHTCLRVAMAAALVLAFLPHPPAHASGHQSTHWTGWYDVYGWCKVSGQMHWRYFADGTREVERHYWRFRKSASTHDFYHYRNIGRPSWNTSTVSYHIPSTHGTYFRKDLRHEPIDSCAGEHSKYYPYDRNLRVVAPMVVHEVKTECHSPCLSFANWHRIGIGGSGNPPWYWKTLAEGGYVW